MEFFNTVLWQNLLVRRQSNWFNRSTKHEVMSHCGNSMKTLNIYICIATQLQFWWSSIIAGLSNAEWLKYHWSNLFWAVPQPRPWQNSPCTCRLPRHPQDVNYKRSTSGALPLATTFKCEFVAWTMLLSSCEPLAGAARQEAASGEPSGGRHNNKRARPPGGRFWWAQWRPT